MSSTWRGTASAFQYKESENQWSFVGTSEVIVGYEASECRIDLITGPSKSFRSPISKELTIKKRYGHILSVERQKSKSIWSQI